MSATAPLPSARLEALTALAAEAEREDGQPPFNEQSWVLLRTGSEHVATVLLGDADAPDGAAVVTTEPDAPAIVELVVRPTARRRGVGARLADEVRTLLDAAGVGEVHAWSHGGDPGAAVLAARHGLAPVRELWSMSLDVAEHTLPALPRLPDGVRLRGFVVGQDEQAWLRVNAAAFSHHPEQGRMTLADLRERERSAWFDPSGFLLAVDERDTLLGFHWTKVEAGVDGTPGGEVYVVGISPDAQGRGLGRTLTLAGLHHLRDAGLRRILLYVDADNTAAVGLYTSLGFRRADTDVMYALARD